jgi:L-amino acid N-acyltransferase YncA
VNLRDASEADLPAIVAIYNEAIPTRRATAQLDLVTPEERLPWFREHSPEHHPIWVLELDGTIAGWLSFSRFITRCAYDGTAEISVYVAENFQRRGVGRELLAAAVARAPALGLTALLGLIFGHNEASLQLFSRFGFERWGTLPRVARLDGVERDVVIVGRHLGKRMLSA